MDPQVLAGNPGCGVSGWSVVWAMAAAALPKSEEGRQQPVGIIGNLGQQKEIRAQGTHVGSQKGGFEPFGGKVQQGVVDRKRFTATSAMVKGQAWRRSIEPRIHISDKGGWQPWSTRGTISGNHPAQVNQSKGCGIQAKRIGTSRAPETVERRGRKGKGRGQEEHPSSVKDAGGSGIANLVTSQDWRRKAVTNLRGKMFAKSTLASKASGQEGSAMLGVELSVDGSETPVQKNPQRQISDESVVGPCQVSNDVGDHPACVSDASQDFDKHLTVQPPGQEIVRWSVVAHR